MTWCWCASQLAGVLALLGAVGAAPPATMGGVLGVAPANYSRYAVGAEGFRCFDGRGVGAVWARSGGGMVGV